MTGPRVQCLYRSDNLAQPETSPVQSAGFLPLYALLGIAISTGMALALVPVDTTPAGALRLSTMIQAAGLLLGPGLWFARSPRLALRVESLLMVGLVYWILLDTMQGRYGLAETTAQGVADAILAVGLFAGCIWATVLIPPVPLPRFLTQATRVNLSDNLLIAGACTCFGLGMFHYAYTSDFDPFVMAEGLTQPRFDTPWMQFRISGSYGGSWLVVGEQLGNFGLLLPLIVTLIGRRSGYLSVRAAFVLVLSLVYMAFVFHAGNRRVIGAAVAAALLVHVLLAARVRFRDLAFGFVGLLGLLVLLEVAIATRSSEKGFAALGKGEIEFNEGLVVRVDDNFLRLAQVTTLFPVRYDYLYLDRVWFTLTRPIPRVLWPDKPTTPGFDLAVALDMGGMSLSASVVADGYMSAGYVGVAFTGLLFGLLAGVWNQLLTRRISPAGVILYSLGLMTIFVGLRSLDELFFQSYPLIAWLILTKVLFVTASRVGRS